MSSEVYIRWDVQNQEYLNQQLKIKLAKEREHQAELLRQMNKEIEGIMKDITAAKSSAATDETKQSATTEQVGNIFNYKTDEVLVEGLSSDVENVEVGTGNVTKRKLEVVDWSSLIDSVEEESSDKVKKLVYAREINAQLAAAVLDSNECVQAHNSFVTYLNNLLDDSELDFEYFKKLITPRFELLKQKITIISPEDVNDDLLEYYALCELLKIKPKKVERDNLEAEIKKLFERYTEKETERYVYDNLMEVFAELNMSVADEMELDGLMGRRVTDDALSDCSIFMSMDRDGIIFETVAEVDDSESLSSDKKALLEQSAHKVCQKHLMVIRKMQERGINLQIECEEKPKIERMRKIKKRNSRKTVRGKKQGQYLER